MYVGVLTVADFQFHGLILTCGIFFSAWKDESKQRIVVLFNLRCMQSFVNIGLGIIRGDIGTYFRDKTKYIQFIRMDVSL